MSYVIGVALVTLVGVATIFGLAWFAAYADADGEL